MSQEGRRKSGFTIIELMIATTVFSLVLMICLAGIMQITKMYYRGVTQARTREVARTVVDEIAEALRFTNQDVLVGTPVVGPQIDEADDGKSVGYFCIGLKRYTYAIDRIVKNSPKDGTKEQRHALWVDQPTVCTGAVDLTKEQPSPDGKSLLAENMRLYDLTVRQTDPIQRLYAVSIGVAYGEDDLLSVKEDDPTRLTCEGAFVGAEFCSTTNFLVTVQKRL